MTNESILIAHLELIMARRAAGISWSTISDELRAIGVSSAAGAPFNAAALRAYWTKLRPNKADVVPNDVLPGLSLRSDGQGEELAQLTIRYLTTRLVWVFDQCMHLRTGVAPEVDLLPEFLGLLEVIGNKSADVANRVDKAGGTLSQLIFSAAGVRGVTVNREDLDMLRLPADDLDRLMRQQEVDFEAQLSQAPAGAASGA
jgi:hypothetical protein